MTVDAENREAALIAIAEQFFEVVDKTVGSDLFGGTTLPAKPELADIVLSMWNQLAARVPAIPTVRKLTDDRKRKIWARTKAICGADVGRDGVDLWKRIIGHIESNTFLRGEDPPGRGRTEPFVVYLDYVLRPEQFNLINEGAYRANRSAGTHNPETGRRYGPAEQAGRAVAGNILSCGSPPPSQHRTDSGSQAPAIVDRTGNGLLRSAFDRY